MRGVRVRVGVGARWPDEFMEIDFAAGIRVDLPVGMRGGRWWCAHTGVAEVVGGLVVKWGGLGHEVLGLEIAEGAPQVSHQPGKGAERMVQAVCGRGTSR